MSRTCALAALARVIIKNKVGKMPSSSEECLSLSENYHKLTEVLIMILFLAVVVWLAGVVGRLLALIVLLVAKVLRRYTCITCITRLNTCITR